MRKRKWQRNTRLKSTLKKEISGITLIALVVTIIVLLILAGISIMMLSGNNGILTRAEQAKEMTERVSGIEQIQLEILGSYDTDGKLDMSMLKTNLEKMGATVSGENPLKVSLNESKFTIDNSGNVVETGNVSEDLPKLKQYFEGKTEDEVFNEDTNALLNISPILDASTSISMILDRPYDIVIRTIWSDSL